MTSSSTWIPTSLPAGEEWLTLTKHQNQMVSLSAGLLPTLELDVRASEETVLTAEWRIPTRPESQTPDKLLASVECPVTSGSSRIALEFDGELSEDSCAYLILRQNTAVEVALSDQRATGLPRTTGLSEQRTGDSHGQYIPAEEAGCEAFAFWCSDERRPKGKNLTLSLSRPMTGFEPEQVTTHLLRPMMQPNAWVADPADPEPGPFNPAFTFAVLPDEFLILQDEFQELQVT